MTATQATMSHELRTPLNAVQCLALPFIAPLSALLPRCLGCGRSLSHAAARAALLATWRLSAILFSMTFTCWQVIAFNTLVMESGGLTASNQEYIQASLTGAGALL